MSRKRERTASVPPASMSLNPAEAAAKLLIALDDCGAYCPANAAYVERLIGLTGIGAMQLAAIADELIVSTLRVMAVRDDDGNPTAYFLADAAAVQTECNALQQRAEALQKAATELTKLSARMRRRDEREARERRRGNGEGGRC